MQKSVLEQFSAIGIDTSDKVTADIISSLAASPPALGHFPGLDLLGDMDLELSAQAEAILHQAAIKIAAEIEDSSQTDKRLGMLRKYMKEQRIDAFIIPMHDAFFGEYVPFSGQRLPWISGFTGSAGIAVVTLNKAAIFSDGRYTIQIKEQVDEGCFYIGHMMNDPLSKWLSTHLEAGHVLGLDAQLHNSSDKALYQSICESANAQLKWLDVNPIDAVWQDQPSMPLSPVFTLSESEAGQSSSSKRQKIAEGLREKGADAVLITQSDSVAWLLNVRASDVPNTPFVLSYLVMFSDGSACWFVDTRKLDGIVLDTDITIYPIHELETYCAELKNKNVLYDSGSTAIHWINVLLKNNATPMAGVDPCQLPKSIKNEIELSGIKKAHIRDGEAMIQFLCWLDGAIESQVDLNEISVADKLQEFRELSPDLISLSFDTISGFGSNGAICHYRVTEKSSKTLKEGSLYLVDSGGQYKDGTTDITRVIPVGAPDDLMKEHFTLVLKGHIQLSMAEFPEGTYGSQLDVLARLPLWQKGLDYDHGTGHGVGCFLSVHEGPHRIAKKGGTAALQPGMVVSNEPGFYQENGYGIRIENLIYVKACDNGFYGFENLTIVPIDLRLVDTKLMSEKEINWLNDYHDLVFATHKDQLTAELQSWLKNATRKV